jgi:hypothetical protein
MVAMTGNQAIAGTRLETAGFGGNMSTLGRFSLAALRLSATASTASARGTIGIGARITTLDLADQDGGRDLSLDGAGIYLRLNLIPRLGIEIAAEQVSTGDLGGYVRESTPLSASILAYVSRGSFGDLYILCGLGTTTDKVTFELPDRATVTETTEESTLHAGVGYEIDLGSLSLGGELRAVGLKITDGESSALVPAKSKAVQMNLGLTYYF